MEKVLIWLVRVGLKVMQVVGPAAIMLMIVITAINDLVKVMRSGRNSGMA